MERGTVSGVVATNARRPPPLLASKAANCVEKITLSWSAVAVQLQCLVVVRVVWRRQQKTGSTSHLTQFHCGGGRM